MTVRTRDPSLLLPRVGDRVTVDFLNSERHIVRTVTKIWMASWVDDDGVEHSSCESGFLINVDGGNGGTPIDKLDSNWAVPVLVGPWNVEADGK